MRGWGSDSIPEEGKILVGEGFNFLGGYVGELEELEGCAGGNSARARVEHGSPHLFSFLEYDTVKVLHILDVDEDERVTDLAKLKGYDSDVNKTSSVK